MLTAKLMIVIGFVVAYSIGFFCGYMAAIKYLDKNVFDDMIMMTIEKGKRN